MKNYKRSLSESDQTRNNSEKNKPTMFSNLKSNNEYDSSYLQPFSRPVRPYVSSSKFARSNFGMSREELNMVVKNLAVLEKSLDSDSRNKGKISKSKSKPKLKRSKLTKNKLNKSAISSKIITISSEKKENFEYSDSS